MKIFLILLSLFVMPLAYADEEVAESETTGLVVVERMSCFDINTKISELSAKEEPDDDTIIELEKLKSDYRRKCMKSAGGRKTAAQGRSVINNDPIEEPAVIEEVAEETTEVEQVTVKEPDAKPKEQNKKENSSGGVPATEEEIRMFEELVNLDMGLCADGTKPNKFGCCTDEIFKDLGNNVYACCPKTGGDCYPPLK
ncbi:MAG: hypothetical protein IKB59_00420 [Alphaproteobacteria bacterium]|nr:hypothetical protein [Alphaproteobacteria bacterium]